MSLLKLDINKNKKEEFISIKNKDWTGNKKTTYVQLGASNHSDTEREINDFYATDPNALVLFLNKLKEDNIELHNNIWECACGQGHLSKVLIDRGYNVRSTDLVNRGYGESNMDFLQCFNTWNGDILTNPPYKFAEEFVYHALDLINEGYYVIMFLKIQFLEGKSRYKLYQKYPPKYVYVHSSRKACYPNGIIDNKGSATCYCWFIWEKCFSDEPIIRWIE